MRVLVGCERSGVVRQAFRELGHDAWSCDLSPAEDDSTHHIEGDVLDIARRDRWDLLIAHPPCTYLCGSGLHWNGRRPGRAEHTEVALAFVRDLLALAPAVVPRLAIENPRGCIGTRIRKADQRIQPYQYGHDASKETHLWLVNLPRLRPTAYIAPRMVGARPRWANQTDSGQNRLPPSPDRWMMRSRTYDGIAAAMAAQWGRVEY